MFSRWARTWSPRLFDPLIQTLIRLHITPNMLTLFGLALALVSGMLIAFDLPLLAAGGLLLSGLLDALDGQLARACPPPGRLGPFIDSVADHYGDFAIYLGLAWRALARNDSLTVVLIFAAMFGSLVGSHIRSRAGMAGVDLKNTGLFTRAERVIVLLAGLVTGWVMPALLVLAVGNNVSAAQRVIETLKGKEANL